MAGSLSIMERPGRRRALPADRRPTARHDDRGRGATDAGVPALPAPADRARFNLIDMTAETARRTIEANALRLSMEFVDYQRRVIDSIHESTIATLKLAEALSQAPDSAQVADAYLRHRRERSVALHNTALSFFDSAMSLIGVMAAANPTARNPEAPVREGTRASETVARCVAALTLQQRRVLSLLMGGLPNKLIAHELGVTEATVKAHVSQVLQKFNVHSRARVIAQMLPAADLERLN
jgi:DNA-binding CsgD family transcriptional regulator